MNNKYMKKIKEFLNRPDFLFAMLFFFIFIFSDFIRSFLVRLFIDTNIEFFYNVNYFSELIIVLILIKKRKNIDIKVIGMICILIICDIINISFGYTSIKYLFFDSIFIFLPMCIMSINFNKKEFDKIIKCVIKIFNIFTFTVLILGIVDYATNRGVQFLLNNIGYFNNTYSTYLMKLDLGTIKEQYRYLSIFGHPLRNAQLFITFYLLNFLAHNKFNRIGHYIVFTSSMMLGVILSNSKTAMVIGVVISIVCFFITNRKVSIKFILCMLLSLIVLFNTNLFKSTVLSRFKEAIENNDLTSGRNVIFRLIFNGQVAPPRLLGYGEGFSNYIIEATNQNIASLEYPFMVFLFDKGILFTLIFYCIIFLPLFIMIRKKQYKYIFVYLIFNGYVNIYNGIAIHGDYLAQYIITNYIIIMLARFHQKK